ncbi:hypothetical protein [Massilia cavernae]|uniref:Uncharacterized protein n=1 Tax=Massilia cavernae TaxID=2320864 RepID=A0A418XTT6_9BURK|nr:hypothetical protein [Massilia cavernae]RJG16087.1 hypothetical protein D3872_11360 [Massilia cavernae]
MFGSTVLEVAVGLTFCYAAVALIVSTLQEAIASVLRLRARTLLEGVKTMLNDPGFNALARALYAHALVNPHDDGTAGDEGALKHKPSYIEPKQFATALLDTIQTIPGDWAQLGRDIDAVPDEQVRRALQSVYRQANGDLAKLQSSLEGWFDNAMERVSGAYKRQSLMVSLALSLLMAVLFNIDSIHLFRTLWQQPALAAQLSADTLNQGAIDALRTLPIGWQSFPTKFDADFAMQVAGWLLTASTALFGAPFWFDLLQKAVQVRGTGVKPEQRNKIRSVTGTVSVDQDA